MSRPRWISLGALLVVLALLPLLPRGGGQPDTARRAAGPERPTPLTAGYGEVTPAFERTIASVVRADQAPRLSTRTPAGTLVGDLVRCAVFEGQRYCLGVGWTDRGQAEVRRSMTAVAARQAVHPPRTTGTGDLSLIDALRRAARMSPSARAAAQTAELTEAARSVAKVWLLRHQIQGVALPPDFFARHPEVRAGTDSAATAPVTPNVLAPDSPTGKQRPKGWDDYPSRGVVLNQEDVRAQHRTYWCGPTSMQMIAWGWSGRKRYQRHWASKLGTTTHGTSITSMVDVVNRYTGWDKAAYAGPYITLDISDWSFRQWMLLMARHIVDYRAPVILHPVLLTEFYPYLDHDGSGHFQVGRGYRKRDDQTPLLGYFEPWNQHRFHADEPFIDRVQWRNAYRSYRANQEHFQHNLGV